MMRTKRYTTAVAAATMIATAIAAGPGIAPTGAASAPEVTWTATGPCGSVQTLTAPIGARSAVVKITGGGGGKGVGQGGGEGGWGAAGATVTTSVVVESGQKLSVVIGCGGENGKGENRGWNQRAAGGAGWSSGGAGLPGEVIAGVAGSTGGGGGGSSAVCSGPTCSPANSTRILVVAGGGGGGGTSNCATERAGTGGTAVSGVTTSDSAGYGPDGAKGMPGGANSSSAPGGSNARPEWGTNGGDAVQRHGGWAISAAGGGGGGGRVGGRGGMGTWAPPTCQGAPGGGGGSSWVRTGATAVTWQGGRFTAPAPGSATITFTLCGADIRPFGDVGDLVNQQYRDFRGRDANVLERVFSSLPIANCEMTADDYIATFLPTSQTTVEAQLVRMYHAYFKRAPEQGGFEFWKDRIERLRAPLDNVSQYFATSPEFLATYGSLNNGQFVELVYRNVLERPAEPDGRAYWIDQLDRGLRNRGAVMTGFAESAENRTKMTPRVDAFRIWTGMIRTYPTTAQMDAVALPRLFTPSLPIANSVKVARLHSRYAARF